MKTGPLNESELEWLDDILSKYATEGAILDVSELDGLLTAILSGPKEIEPAQWLLAIWGGADNVPRWANDRERDHFVNLTLQHMSDIAERLDEYPDQFEPLFGTREEEGQELTIVEEWCFGYMRGVALGNWPALPEEPQSALDSIALHGTEAQFTAVEALSVDEFIASVDHIRPARSRCTNTGLSMLSRKLYSNRSAMKSRSGVTIPVPVAAVKNISSVA